MKKAIPIIVILNYILVGVAFAFSPCVQDSSFSGYYCDLNGKIYATYSACYSACYATFENSDVQLHVSKSLIELFYLASGVFVGILLILCLLVGLR